MSMSDAHIGIPNPNSYSFSAIDYMAMGDIFLPFGPFNPTFTDNLNNMADSLAVVT
jgi:hypothetical protein